MTVISPFPEDLPVIPLPRLSLARLLASDAEECHRLLEASQHFGCFQLDLSDSPSGHQFLSRVDAAFDVGKAFCAEDMEEKKKFPLDKSNFG